MALVPCRKKREIEQINSEGQIPLPTVRAEQGCRWSNTNTHGSRTHGPALTTHCHQGQTGAQTGCFGHGHRCRGDTNSKNKAPFFYNIIITKSPKKENARREKQFSCTVSEHPRIRGVVEERRGGAEGRFHGDGGEVVFGLTCVGGAAAASCQPDPL